MEAMNPLQGGLNASQLSPQSFQNSSQRSTIGADNIGNGIQSTDLGQNLNTTEAFGGQLRVVTNSQQNLNTSTQAVAAATNQPDNNSGVNWFVLTGMLLLAVLLFVVSFKLFKKSKKPQPQEQEE